VGERAETGAARPRRALPYTRNLVAAPDCGMKYLTREAAFGKLESLVAGAKLVSEELG
jgi:5-methyltetrahydropteroyltriglutamate--homocysteine methyltransferase